MTMKPDDYPALLRHNSVEENPTAGLAKITVLEENLRGLQ
jgi:hypothetical protein